MRISATKPNFNDIDWDKLALEDEKVLEELENISIILEKKAQVNSIMRELYELGLKQKTIGKVFGVGDSSVSYRLKNKVGSHEGIARKPHDITSKYIQVREAQEACPHSEFLEETLLRFRISPRKTQDILLLYVETYPIYDGPKKFYQLLRANRISEKKAKLIISRFFLEDLIPDSIGNF